MRAENSGRSLSHMREAMRVARRTQLVLQHDERESRGQLAQSLRATRPSDLRVQGRHDLPRPLLSVCAWQEICQREKQMCLKKKNRFIRVFLEYKPR